MSKTVVSEQIERKIYLIRGKKVMLSSDLAELYQVETKALVQAVKRNKERFPEDFLFRLTWEEQDSLRSQFVTLKRRGRHVKYLPYAFTEHGIAMLSGVLKSKRAIQINLAIIRTFIRLREYLLAHKELSQKFEALERKVSQHDKDVIALFSAIRKLMAPLPEKPKKAIGFHAR